MPPARHEPHRWWGLAIATLSVSRRPESRKDRTWRIVAVAGMEPESNGQEEVKVQTRNQVQLVFFTTVRPVTKEAAEIENMGIDMIIWYVQAASS
jgi:hypothetical protein